MDSVNQEAGACDIMASRFAAKREGKTVPAQISDVETPSLTVTL
jgi:hypothetical protein